MIKLYNIWMSDFAHYFNLPIKSDLISFILNLWFFYYFYCHLLISKLMFSNTNFTEGSCSNLFSKNKISQTSLHRPWEIANIICRLEIWLNYISMSARITKNILVIWGNIRLNHYFYVNFWIWIFISFIYL